MRLTLSPNGLMGRVTAVLLGALLLEIVAGLLFYEAIDRYSVREDHARRVAELLVVGDRLAARTKGAQRAEALKILSTAHLQVALTASPIVDRSGEIDALASMRQRIVQWEPALAERRLHLDAAGVGRGKRLDLVGTLQLGDGSWLQFRSRDLYARWPLLFRVVAVSAVLGLGVLASTAVALIMLGAPLRRLVVAADAIGHGGIVTMEERGPRDVRQVARAFNAMQARIDRLIADRTQALAAVSHDLRTPLSRLKLAGEHIADPEIAQIVEANIDDMETMLASLLAFLRAEQNPEPLRALDLATLVTTLVDGFRDAGRAADYDGPDHLRITGRSTDLKRAIANLIDNAIKYGGVARVSLAVEETRARLVIADDGPGIPEEACAAVLEPFVRLDEARARNAGGFGLGLPIAARLIAGHGGTLALRPRPGGGLDAVVELPLG